MEIAKYATALLLVVGCGAPEAGEDVASHQRPMGVGAELGGEKPSWQVQTNELNATPAKAKKKSLEVNFNDCTEFAGLTFVPTENVRDLVPPEFALAHFTTEAEAVVVVRVANCSSVRVKGGRARAGTVAQVGVTLAGPDATSDINNYTLWYVTDNKELARELAKLGVDAEYSANIDYEFDGGSGTGAFNIGVFPGDAPDYFMTGTATTPSSAAVPFVASWWYETCRGTVQMRTNLPEIQFGASAMSLNALGDDLQDIVGSSPVGFPGLDSFNSFDEATMIVSVD